METLNSEWVEQARVLRRSLGYEGRDTPELPSADAAGPQEALEFEVELRRDGLFPKLFDYQRELSEQMVEVIESGSRALLSLPTGAGKTRTAAVALLRALAGTNCQRAAWLAPSVELVDQAFDGLAAVWRDMGQAPDVTLTRRQPRVDLTRKSIWVTTPQAVYALVRSGKLVPGIVDFTIFDEAHQLGASTFRSAVQALTKPGLSTNGRALVGLSATPGRSADSETEDLVELFHGRLLASSKLGNNPVATLQRRGVLAQLQFRRLPDPGSSADSEVGRLRVAIDAARVLAEKQHRVLIFCESVPGAVVAAEGICAGGVPAAAIHSGLARSERLDVIESFASGRVEVLTNMRLLATGYDCPAVTDVMILGRVSSNNLFEQIVGRGARGPRTGGSRISTVWDFDDHLRIHGLPQSYYRYRDFDWSSS